MVGSNRQFNLRHIRHETKMNETFYSMFCDQSLVDVILSSDGTNLRAHRLILSANSSYFKSLFDSLESNRCQIPIVILKDVPLSDLKAIIEFMYRGEVCVDEKQLTSVLKSAELLKVCGLTEVCQVIRSQLNEEMDDEISSPSPQSSGHSSNKRPRITEGIKKPSKTCNDFISKLTNDSSLEIRSNTPSPVGAIQSPNSHLNAIKRQNKTKLKTIKPNVDKNNSNQRNVYSMNSQTIPKTPIPMTTSAYTQPITASNTHQKSPTLLTYSSALKSLTIAKHLQTSATYTLNQAMVDKAWAESESSVPESEAEPPVLTPEVPPTLIPEVLIDETTEVNDEEMDIKPPIFELEERLRLAREAKERQFQVIDCEPEVSPNSTEIKKIDYKKSRRSSTSSQSSITSLSSLISLPPPPTYRVVQRSSSRLLRKNIKPTAFVLASATTASNKTKESEDKCKTVIKKERQKALKPGLDLSAESIPEIECPSCGLKFNDEKKWDEHIASAHPPLQT